MSDDEFGFSDDLVFDQETLEAIDAQSEQVLAQQRTDVEERPTKRQKIDHPVSLNTLEDLELPDITFDSIAHSFAHSTPLPIPNATPTPTQPKPIAGLARKPPRPNPALRAEIERALSQQPEPTTSSQQYTHPTGAYAQPSRQPTRQTNWNSSAQRPPQARVPPTSRPPSQRSMSANAPFHSPTTAQPSESSNSEMARLIKEVERLKADHEQMNQSLKDAQSAKLAKEGEVSILRRNMDKSQQSHQAAINSLRAAKAEADARLVRAEKEWKEELERVRTEGLFRQQEFMADTMGVKKERVPPSVRTKRTGNVFATPSRSNFPPPLPIETPVHPRTPSKSPSKRMKIDSPEQGRKDKALPGFTNAFDEAPLPDTRPNFNALAIGAGHGKGKERERTPSPLHNSPTHNRGRYQDSGTPTRRDAGMLDLAVEQPSSSASSQLPGSSARHNTIVNGDIFQPRSPPFASGLNGLGGSPIHWDDRDAKGDVKDIEPQEEEEDGRDDVEWIDWKAELSRIILTHTPPTSNGTVEKLEQPTIQQLMAVTGRVLEPSNADHVPSSQGSQTEPESQDMDEATAQEEKIQEGWNAYSSHLARIFETISRPSYTHLAKEVHRGMRPEKDPPYLVAVEQVSRHFIGMSWVLVVQQRPQTATNRDRLVALTSLFNLLVILCYTLPSFGETLLKIGHGTAPMDDLIQMKQEEGVVLTDLLCRATKDHLSQVASPEKRALARELIGLLEALCWYVPDELALRLSSIFRDGSTLSIFLEPSQPQWILTRTTRFMALLSSHKKVSRSLLIETGGALRLPCLDIMCNLLVDLNRQDAEAVEMQSYILTFWTMLSVSHPDTLAVLTESHLVIPSLVLFLTCLTAPLWESDSDSEHGNMTANIRIGVLSRTLFLLHHLIFSASFASPTSPTSEGSDDNVNGGGEETAGTTSGEVVDLRQKLHHAPSRPFSGLSHMFVVTFGRLSYADPPSWVDQQGKDELENVVDMARDLLELVVDGPELDGIWAAYQEDPDEANQMDEEEMESQLLSDG